MSKSVRRSANPLSFVLSVLVVLVCGLAAPLSTDSHEASLAMSGSVYPGLLDYEPGVPVCKQEATRVRNPGFEEGIGSEYGWIGAGSSCTFLEDDPGHASPASVRIFSEDSVKKDCKLLSRLTETPFEAGRSYDYSAWIKANLQAGRAYLAVTFWRENGGTLKLVGVPALTNWVSNTQGAWVQVTGWTEAPADAEYVRVEATLAESSQGSVWFDDIYLGLSTCLNISKSHDPHEVLPGSTLTYTIAFSNSGREKATAVRIVEEYDENVQLIWAEPTPIAGNLWLFNELPAGGQGGITAVVRVEDGAAGRSWLVNTVHGFSTEISRPISYTLHTPVVSLTHTCAIDLDVVDGAETGRLGQTLSYSLILENVGDCAGQASLTAEVPSGWDYNIDPPTCNIPINDARSAKLTLEIPDGPSGGNSNGALIRAILDCEAPCQNQAIDDELIDISIALPVFLPLVLRDPPRTCWESELNNRCSEADGPIKPGLEYYGYTNDNRDLWQVLVPGSRLRVDLAIVPEAGVQLFLVDANCEDVGYCYDITPEDGYRLDCIVPPGLYYVDIWAANPIPTYPPYILKVTIPE